MSAVGSAKRPGIVLAIILVGYFMILLDNSIIFTGIPTIRDSLGFSDTGISWVQSAYTLTFGGFLLLAARAGDMFGRRRVFQVGLLIFAVASLAIGLAQSPAWIISARAVQGIGSAILAPSTLALLQANFEGEARSRAVAWYGAVAGIGASVGLVVSGLVTDLLSWRVGFLINVPIGIALIIAARLYLPETPRTRDRLDIAGAVLSTVGITALVHGIVRSTDTNWSDTQVVISLITAAVLLIAFVVVERIVTNPVLPLRLFASTERVGAYVSRLFFLGAMIGFFFFVTQLLQEVDGFSPLQAGLAFLPMSLVNFPVALAVPRLARRFGESNLLAFGIAVAAIGMLWLSRVDADNTFLTDIALPMALIGVGQGCAFAPLTSSGIAGVRNEDAGSAAGLVNVAHQLGFSLGLAVLIAVFANANVHGLTDREALAHQVSAAITGGAVLMTLSFVSAVALIVPNSSRPQIIVAHDPRDNE